MAIDCVPAEMVTVLRRLSYSDGAALHSLRYIADGRLTITFSIVTVVRGELLQVGGGHSQLHTLVGICRKKYFRYDGVRHC